MKITDIFIRKAFSNNNNSLKANQIFVPVTVISLQSTKLVDLHSSFAGFSCKYNNRVQSATITQSKAKTPQTAWLWGFLAPVTGLEPVAS